MKFRLAIRLTWYVRATAAFPNIDSAAAVLVNDAEPCWVAVSIYILVQNEACPTLGSVPELRIAGIRLHSATEHAFTGHMRKLA